MKELVTELQGDRSSRVRSKLRHAEEVWQATLRNEDTGFDLAQLRKGVLVLRKPGSPRTEMSFCTEGEANAFFLKHLLKKWLACQACPLARKRHKVVPGAGSVWAEVLVVGEAPGETEDLQGRPFVAREGVLLRACLAKAGFVPRDYFLTTVVACRPKGDRKPEAEERKACEPRLGALAEILRPRVIVLLGAVAAKWVGIRDGLETQRGALGKKAWPELPGGASVRLRGVVLTDAPRLASDAVKGLVADLRRAKIALDKARAADVPAEPPTTTKAPKVDETTYTKGGA